VGKISPYCRPYAARRRPHWSGSRVRAGLAGTGLSLKLIAKVAAVSFACFCSFLKRDLWGYFGSDASCGSRKLAPLTSRSSRSVSACFILPAVSMTNSSLLVIFNLVLMRPDVSLAQATARRAILHPYCAAREEFLSVTPPSGLRAAAR